MAHAQGSLFTVVLCRNVGWLRLKESLHSMMASRSSSAFFTALHVAFYLGNSQPVGLSRHRLSVYGSSVRSWQIFHCRQGTATPNLSYSAKQRPRGHILFQGAPCCAVVAVTLATSSTVTHHICGNASSVVVPRLAATVCIKACMRVCQAGLLNQDGKVLLSIFATWQINTQYEH